MCVATTYARYRALESGVVHRRLTYHHGGIGAPQREGSDKGTPGESRGRKAEGPRAGASLDARDQAGRAAENTRESSCDTRSQLVGTHFDSRVTRRSAR